MFMNLRHKSGLAALATPSRYVTYNQFRSGIIADTISSRKSGTLARGWPPMSEATGSSGSSEEAVTM